MLISILLAAILVTSTFWFHYRVLRGLSAIVPHLNIALEARVLAVIIVAFVAHLVEALVYGAGFLLTELLSLGSLVGPVSGEVLDYFYYSLVTYTSLGLGDVAPTGHLRFLTGVEPINGLLLIAWSGSYTYLAMGRLWPWRPCE